MAISITNIITSKAPALPQATVDYSRLYQDQYNGILRLYFSTLDGINSALLAAGGSRFLSSPRGSFYSTQTQTATANTATIITLNETVTADTLDFSVENNLSAAPTRITAAHTGVYNIQFSLQLQNTDTAQHEFDLWFRINGTDVDNSNTTVTVPARKNASIFGYAVAAWNFFTTLNADDYVELVWATNSTLVTVPYNGATALHPATPSVIVTVSFVSRVPP
jgi:hypothetical protein